MGNFFKDLAAKFKAAPEGGREASAAAVALPGNASSGLSEPNKVAQIDSIMTGYSVKDSDARIYIDQDAPGFRELPDMKLQPEELIANGFTREGNYYEKTMVAGEMPYYNKHIVDGVHIFDSDRVKAQVNLHGEIRLTNLNSLTLDGGHLADPYGRDLFADVGLVLTERAAQLRGDLSPAGVKQIEAQVVPPKSEFTYANTNPDLRPTAKTDALNTKPSPYIAGRKGITAPAPALSLEKNASPSFGRGMKR